MRKFTVIIPVLNLKTWTQHSIEHLCKNTSEDYDLIVVDNGSNRSTKELLVQLKNDGKISKIITNNDNMGSAMAWNQGIKETHTEFVCLLHSDALVSKDWEKPLLKILENNQDIVCSIPVTNYADENFVRYNDLFLDRYVKMKPGNKEFPSYLEISELIETFYEGKMNDFSKTLSDKSKDCIRYLSEISTFCTMFRTNTFNQYGFFDTDFYPHFGFDKLFFYKLQSKGFEAVCCLDSYVHHNGNSTSDGPGNNLSTIIKRNLSILENKMHEVDKRVDIVLTDQEKKEILNPTRSLNRNLLMNLNVTKILCIRNNDPGDIVQCLLLLNGLKNLRRGIEIDFMTHEKNFHLVNSFGIINKVLPFPVKNIEPNIYENVVSHIYSNCQQNYDAIINWTLYPEQFPNQDLNRLDVFNNYLNVDDLKTDIDKLLSKTKIFIDTEVSRKIQSHLNGLKTKILILPDGKTRERSIPNKCIEKLWNRFDHNKYSLIYNSDFDPSPSIENVKSISYLNQSEIMSLINQSDFVITTDNYYLHLAYLLKKPFIGIILDEQPSKTINHLTDSKLDFRILYEKELINLGNIEEENINPTKILALFEELSKGYKTKKMEEESVDDLF